jgi:hypothetical protein
MRTLERAQEQVAKGNLWRAKEILRGSINNVGYDAKLFEALGAVLLKMSDLPEAGRFLFLSAARQPEYEQAIEVFLRRHRCAHWRDFFNVFPRRARLATLSEYPDRLAEELRQFGFPERLQDPKRFAAIPEKVKERLLWATCLSIVLVLGALLILGVIKLKEALF